MPFIRPDLWLPVGVDSLEPTADHVVRFARNTLVVAGPGAGKTELLAQRACYLLQTGESPNPQRILAISFKRDAAKNLGDRVRRRCGDRAIRFDSYTLDAFAKSLVDRFRLALPDDWRPIEEYEVMTKGMRVDDMREWLQMSGFPDGVASIDIEGLSNDEIMRTFDSMAHGQVLPYSDANTTALIRFWGLRWWQERLRLPPTTPSLTFPMLNRLAAFLLRTNPKLIVALRASYSHVFLDEFQDTTAAQYDIVRAGFLGSPSSLTAVGDSKQRIMLWAGAMANVFDVYQTDFAAERNHLTRNYRSAAELVKMQQVIAEAVEAGTPPASAVRTDHNGSCSILEFTNEEKEAEYLAILIEQGISKDGKRPRDYCVLVRQLTGNMIKTLKGALAVRGIKMRDESQLQDVLAEPIVKFIVAVLCLATRDRDAEAWEILTNEVALLIGLDRADDAHRIEEEAKRLIHQARICMNDGSDIATLPSALVASLGESVFRSVYRQYSKGTYLKTVVDTFAQALQTSFIEAGSILAAVDDLVGDNVVPAMTIHKSKGLEFHTVIFLGLEDAQWWSFAKQADEDKRGFFVAFSRAIAQVYFTFCDTRDGRWGRKCQDKAQIGDLYGILQLAGVPTIRP